MSNVIRRRVLVSGQVQGVSFRAYARAAGRNIGVTGWVRNLSDGRVEAVVEGTSENVGLMLAWFHKGSPFGRVDRVTSYEEVPTGEFHDFDISFGYGNYW